MQLIVQNIWMANTPSAAKVRHSSSISFCLVWSSYFIFGNFKERKKKHIGFVLRTQRRVFNSFNARVQSICV